MFKLLKISTEQFAIIEALFNPDDENIRFSLEIKFGINENRDVIATSIKFIFSQDNPFLILQVSCFFEIKSPLIKEAMIIEQDTARHLLLLTIGTARGVMHAKTEGTIFNKFVIPTINLYKIITEDIDLSKNKKIINEKNIV
ncbi:hypothetical protein [Raineya orbicola]|uniref:Uncharacterized protein n=1 Tax=Raineya orbicola TaxID=2016530 RepID=A0A2N3II42_9BACT|nr:hypothetical protein [Raineya orbicola]PKQ69977.1 hypothetical protein Rain11_1042 [Raineya orbicola]